MNAPAPAVDLLNPLDFDLREDVHPFGNRHGEVVHIQSILGLEVAPGDAIAAHAARALRHAMGVRSIDIEVDGEVQSLGMLAELLRPPLQSLNLQ